MEMSVKAYAAECQAKGLRGDYSVCRPDFTVVQPTRYSAEDEQVWSALTRRQVELTGRFAHSAYLAGLGKLGLTEGVPRFDHVNAKLGKLTGWEIVAVPGLIPAEAFFSHLAARRFPVTNWLRSAEELDYIVEPDMFHDFFGHVPILTQPTMADFMQLYGQRALEAIEIGGVEMITRLYWYTAEYGLIREAGQPLKAYGAGLMSSSSELTFALTDTTAKHRSFNVETVMRTSYEIDSFQRVYFVLRSFAELLENFAKMDFGALIRRHKDTAPIDPATL